MAQRVDLDNPVANPSVRSRFAKPQSTQRGPFIKAFLCHNVSPPYSPKKKKKKRKEKRIPSVKMPNALHDLKHFFNLFKTLLH